MRPRLLRLLFLPVLLAHVLAQRLALGRAQRAVAVGVVLLEPLGAPGLVLGADRVPLLGVDLAVLVRVVLLEELRSRLVAAGLPIRPGRRLLLGIEDSVVVGVVLLE